MANTFVSLRRLQRFYNGLKNKFALKSDIKTPDWNAQAITDETSGETTYEDGYIENKPKIRAGTGSSAVVIGNSVETLASGQASVFHGSRTEAYGNGRPIYLTGEANATTYNYIFTPSSNPNNVDTITVEARANNLLELLDTIDLKLYLQGNNYSTAVKITGYDSENKTITVENTLSSSALSKKAAYFSWTPGAYGTAAIAVGYSGASFGTASFSQGRRNLAQGMGSHAEGLDTLASGEYAHSEGRLSVADYPYSHAEGYETYTGGDLSAVVVHNPPHAEGSYTGATGKSSHAENTGNWSFGDFSHVEGQYNNSYGTASHVQGKFSINDTEGIYAHIVGNGTNTTNRSNAHTLDWSGNSWYSGTVSAGTIATPATVVNANDLTTKAYVDSVSGGGSLSLNGNVITLTNSNGTTSSITLPVYNGGVTT